MREFQIDGAACLLGALAVLLLPLDWLLSAVTAAVFHEGCHILAIILSGGRVSRVSVGSHGTVIETGPMSGVQEALCALAGPLGSLSLLLLARYLPMIALCGAVQGLFNFMPLYPLDGGRVLRHLAGTFLPSDTAGTLVRWVEIVCFAAVIGVCVFCSVTLRMGLLPALLALSWVYRAILRKKSCKPPQLAVQ